MADVQDNDGEPTDNQAAEYRQTVIDRGSYYEIPLNTLKTHIHQYDPDEDYVVFTCKFPECKHQVITERDGPDANRTP